jgi:N6-L-threonylcarbamoyladenine synthase
VGLSFAKALAWGRDIPLVAVHHLEGHLSAAFVEEEIAEPFVGLVVSGGHTALYHCEARGTYRQLGTTLDDAAGEAFDKVAKILGLGYPGGVAVDRLAKEGKGDRFPFPRPLLDRDNLDFSFSGLKTALRVHAEKFAVRGAGAQGGDVAVPLEPFASGMNAQELQDTCASFQRAVVESLWGKSIRAVQRTGVKTLVVCGGVACNSLLREHFRREAEKKGLRVVIPKPRYCTDNAVMIASAGTHRFLQGERAQMDVNAVPTWPLS